MLDEGQQALAACSDYNFDHPDAFDFELLISVLRKLKKGKSVKVPVYDFTTHSRRREWVGAPGEPGWALAEWAGWVLWREPPGSGEWLWGRACGAWKGKGREEVGAIRCVRVVVGGLGVQRQGGGMET